MSDVFLWTKFPVPASGLLYKLYFKYHNLLFTTLCAITVHALLLDNVACLSDSIYNKSGLDLK